MGIDNIEVFFFFLLGLPAPDVKGEERENNSAGSFTRAA